MREVCNFQPILFGDLASIFNLIERRLAAYLIRHNRLRDEKRIENELQLHASENVGVPFNRSGFFLAVLIETRCKWDLKGKGYVAID